MSYLILIWAAVIIASLTLYFRQLYSHFSKYGVKHFQPIPPLGNVLRIVLRLDHFTDDINKLYYAFPKERFVGKFEFLNPILMVRDIELVKKVTVKDFEYFFDRRSFIDEKIDPLFGRNLFSLKGQEWKDMRSTLSPVFTNSKVRLMVPFMVEVSEQMMKALNIKMKDSGVDYMDVDFKELMIRYANDVIASCAFGLKVDSYMDEENQFYRMGKLTTTINFRQVFTFIGFASCPKLMKALKISLFSEISKTFFKNLMMRMMKDRETQHIIRSDMIHLLMEAKKGKLTHDDKSPNDVDAGFATVEESAVGKKSITRVWSDDDLIAQAVLFFVAGLETVSSTMSFLLHELAVHPEVQERLVQEKRENETRNAGKFDYKSIQNLVYMYMIVSEVLRLWPPVVALGRVCNKDYNMGKPNSEAKEDFILRKGNGLSIPVWAFHRDPEYFPDPLKFDPERFSEQNKHNIKPFTYMPFGLGPRNCIASRFALCEVKVMAYQLLQHMEVSPCEKTCIPARLATDSFSLSPKGGHWLRLKPRN